MTLYLIGGLGADRRVFEKLTINFKTKVIEWIEPNANESLPHYASRLVDQINQNETFGILGVSFGGLVTIELSKILKPRITFIISSALIENHLPKHLLRLGALLMRNVLPNGLIKPPSWIANYLFGAENKILLASIINDTNPDFIRWAIKSMASWENDIIFENCIRIHGTNDRLFPLKGKAIEILDGGHFMIVDRSSEISQIINEKISNVFDS
jgi:hypothetical protein